MGEPTTLCSVLPFPGNCVCFWRTNNNRWTPMSPPMMIGRISTWMVNSLGMMAVPG
jgi:hypothetical protein